jgi:hypothetical protein
VAHFAKRRQQLSAFLAFFAAFFRNTRGGGGGDALHDIRLVFTADGALVTAKFHHFYLCVYTDLHSP